MNTCVYTAKLKHKREKPAKNSFQYSIYMFYFDLDELSLIQNRLLPFSYNKYNLFSFLDKDHFKFVNDYQGDINVISKEKINFKKELYRNKNTKERILTMLDEIEVKFKPGKIFLLTNVRTFGYVFNPVSFYYCFDTEGRLRVLFSEVNNTFLDQKMFYSVIENPEQEEYYEKQQKNYYISPFIDHDTELHWTFKTPGEKLAMKIDSVKKGGEAVLATDLRGERKELSNWSLFYLLLRYPLYNLMVIVMIHFQALKLWIKKVPFRRKAETDKEIVQTIKGDK